MSNSGVIAEIVTTGTEILLGEIVDTNAAWIAQQLREAGVSIYYKTTVGDNEERLRGVLEQSLSRSDVIILTGGLGPTVDDITRQAVAAATQRPLELHEDALEQLKARFERFGSVMSENNVQQARIPHGATLIPNPVGTAPGFIAERGGAYVIALPGVPREMKVLMQETVLPWLQERVGSVVIRRRILRTMGIGESSIDALFDDLMHQSNPTMGLAAHTGQCDIRIAARADGEEAANAMLDEIEAQIRAKIEKYIYSTVPGESYETVIARTVQALGKKVALLETNTGGSIATRLQHALTDGTILAAAYSAQAQGAEAAPFTLAEALSAGNDMENAARHAAAALQAISGAEINVAVVGTTGSDEGVYGKNAGESWVAITDGKQTIVNRVPFGGTDDFTAVRIGNQVLRMISDMAVA
jgi:nicotinamide-nucleotide amidase